MTTIPTIKTSGKMAAIYSPLVLCSSPRRTWRTCRALRLASTASASFVDQVAQLALVDVQVEWDTSYGSDLSAYWSRSAYECPAGYPIGVRTYKYPGGVPTLSSGVSFSFVVN
ncbi:MAG: hypothetical protein V9E81_10130 [Marmoricola sp.]